MFSSTLTFLIRPLHFQFLYGPFGLKGWGRGSKVEQIQPKITLLPFTPPPSKQALSVWKLDTQSILGTLRLAQSKFGKTFKYASKSWTKKKKKLLIGAGEADCSFFQYKCPQTPHFARIRRFQAVSGQILSLLSLIFHLNTSKHIRTPSNMFDSSFFTIISRQCSCTQSSSPWFHTLDLRFRRVDIAFQ